MNFTAPGADACLRGLAQAAVGGRICLFDSDGLELVAVPVPDGAFEVDVGELALSSKLEAEIAASGRAARYELVGGSGVILLQGTVGTKDSAADLRVSAVDLGAGARFFLDEWAVTLPWIDT